jgi:hypothetical protein
MIVFGLDDSGQSAVFTSANGPCGNPPNSTAKESCNTGQDPVHETIGSISEVGRQHESRSQGQAPAHGGSRSRGRIRGQRRRPRGAGGTAGGGATTRRVRARLRARAGYRGGESAVSHEVLPPGAAVHLLSNSNHMVADWLRRLGCKVRGPAFGSRWWVQEPR